MKPRLPHPDELSDPLNRVYRYPTAKALAPLLIRLGLRPNAITGLHTLVGFSASYALLQDHYLASVALFEVRGILDCADGVVARLTGKGSPHGHAIDALGDSLSFVVFVGVLVTKLMEADFPPLLSFTLGLGLLLTTALAGIFHDQFKMQIADVLLGRPDRLAAEWKRLKAGSEKNLGLTRLRFWFLDTSLKLASQPYALQLRRAPRLAVPLTEELTPSRELRALIRAVSLVGGDNVLALLSFGLLAVALSPVPFHASVWVGTVVGSILYSVASVPHVFYRFSKFYQTLASKPERKS